MAATDEQQKAQPFTFDLGHLMCIDTNPLPSLTTATADKEAIIAATAQACAQGLINQLLTACPIIRSSDGKAALWAGAIDDIWKLGKARGHGGPWFGSAVKKGIPSDPYLMTAYDRTTLTLPADTAVTLTAEIDLTGEGRWASYQAFEVKPGTETTHTFPAEFQAYWIRFKASEDCTATARLVYE